MTNLESSKLRESQNKGRILAKVAKADQAMVVTRAILEDIGRSLRLKQDRDVIDSMIKNLVKNGKKLRTVRKRIREE